MDNDNQTGITKIAHFVYTLTLGKVISTSEPKEDLVLEQGVRKLFEDKAENVSYYVTLHGVKVNKKIYQPIEIEAELDFMMKTTDRAGGEELKAPSFEAVTAMFSRREVKLEVAHVKRQQETTTDTGNTYTVAEKCYVYELDPQLRRDSNGMKMYVKLNIFSMDKLMTLNKYCKAYVARKLGSGILKPESITFGKEADGETPLIKTNIRGLRFLKYNEDVSFTDKNGKKTTASIPSEFIQPYLVQYNESFYDFLVRTANRCGEFLYFEDGALTLGLANTGEPVEINDFESVTKPNISAGPLSIEAYARDSVKDDIGEVKHLNQSVIDKQKTGYPGDAFRDHTSSNAELANDEYFFPLVKDKFSDVGRETYLDGTKSQNAMARVFPFLKMILGNETDGGAGIGANIGKLLFVAEGAMDLKSVFQKGTTNAEGQKAYLDPYDGIVEQYDKNKVVQFSSLKEEGWTTLKYYNDIHKHESEQQRQIICINMGTDYANVKLGQKIKVEGLKGSYVVIQMVQVSEEVWDYNYDKYDTAASDTYNGTRSQKIYAIPAYKDADDDNKEKFIPPVQPVPVIRKAGPQVAFVTANVDPKFQGRVRVAYPWQALGSALPSQMAYMEQQLAEANGEKDRLEEEGLLLPGRILALESQLKRLKKYVNATKEQRQEMLGEQALKRDGLEKEIQELEASRAEKDPQLVKLETDIKAMKYDPESQSEKELKQVELEMYKRDTMAAEIKAIDAKIADKRKEIEQLEAENEELIAAAKEHDEKKGVDEGYLDIETDNTVIVRKKRAYNQSQKDYKDHQQKMSNVKKLVKDRESQKDKVKEYIDKDALSMSTPWIRVATPMATPGGGTFFRPRVGDEVLVNFDNDNVERPYVVGSLFSKNTLTPDEGLYRKAAPEIQWKNISMSMMSPNGHHITFTDPPGGASFISNVISPGMGFYASVLPGLSTLNGMGENYKDLNGGIHIGDRYGLYEIEMKSQKRSIDIRSPFGTVSVNAFSGITISAPNGNIAIKGKNITLEAGNKITMLSGKNIADPDIGDPEGKWTQKGKMAVGVVGAILEAGVAPDFIEAVVDFSLIRHVVEVFARPVDGTLLLKSKRYLKLEAGNGNATIKRDRYADTVTTKKETSEEFYKTILFYVNTICSVIDKYYHDFALCWRDGTAKRRAYEAQAVKYLKDKKDPDIFTLFYDWNQPIENVFSPEDFKGKYKDSTLPHINEAYADLTKAAEAYGRAMIKMRKTAESFDDLFSDIEDKYVGSDVLGVSMLAMLIAAFKDFKKTVLRGNPVKTWKDFYYTKGFLFNDEISYDMGANTLITGGDSMVFKRKLILAFIWHVANSSANKTFKYIETGYDLDYILTTSTFRQEYYWKRQILNMDHYWQKHKFWRTLMENTYNKFVDKFKSNFAPFDKDIWSDKAEGQILFSDNEGSTLNFQGEGLHEESDSNIGTMQHLKKVLMGIK